MMSEKIAQRQRQSFAPSVMMPGIRCCSPCESSPSKR